MGYGNKTKYLVVLYSQYPRAGTTLQVRPKCRSARQKKVLQAVGGKCQFSPRPRLTRSTYPGKYSNPHPTITQSARGRQGHSRCSARCVGGGFPENTGYPNGNLEGYKTSGPAGNTLPSRPAFKASLRCKELTTRWQHYTARAAHGLVALSLSYTWSDTTAAVGRNSRSRTFIPVVNLCAFEEGKQKQKLHVLGNCQKKVRGTWCIFWEHYGGGGRFRPLVRKGFLFFVRRQS